MGNFDKPFRPLCLLAVWLVLPLGCGESEPNVVTGASSSDTGPVAKTPEREASSNDEEGEARERKERDEQRAAAAKLAAPPVKLDAPPDLAKGAERWQFTLTVGMRVIDLLVDFAPSVGDQWTATMGLPEAGLYRIALQEVEYSTETMNFTLYKPANPKASEMYGLVPSTDGRATGTVSINGVELPVTGRKLAGGETYQPSTVRPQTPKPPFPYMTQEMTFTNAKDGVKRTGTLSIPTGPGPHPVVIIESGSGSQDRDGSMANHKPYLVIADHLARKGIGSFRSDDRGVGGSTGVDAAADHEALTGDMLAMVAGLKKVKAIDPTKIGVMGHSQGGSIAPLAATRSRDVAFVIMLAGIGLPGDRVMMDQKRLMAAAAGKSGEHLKKMMAHQRKTLDAVLNDADEAALRKLITESLDIDLIPVERMMLKPEMRQKLIDNGVRMVSANFFRSLVKAKPKMYLSQVTVPILAVWGLKDLQVEPMSNSEGFKEAMFAAKNKDAEVWLVPRMSHNFQETDTGKIEEYPHIKETVRPILLRKLDTWIRTKTGLLAKTVPATPKDKPSSKGRKP